MACILHIETSTTVCSVAVSEDSKVIFEQQTLEGPSHATVLAPYVDEALSFIESHAIPLDAVAISAGPGSYTGLRIGTSVAKGVTYGRNVLSSSLCLLCSSMMTCPKMRYLCP